MEELAKVNVLGTEYTVIQESDDERGKLSIQSNYDGYCDFTSKTIYISDISEDNGYIKDNLLEHRNRTIRHELVHAFLYESGLDHNSDWARNEEIVDWVAIQFPKLKTMFEEIDIC
ncbi:hypothetical protein [Facklamia sp. 7083-14-GEN3]|uniref:hypothetical protein n=1 Tax=Facklamia sp. 7083-14-GEN3 TaxID=2973478 RepID=UPI00215BF8E6|nr:hypothetical protein [Facklamia sp. 7083-14-GEN3]MCR8969281.1 hypothetical protein [Facklamia sp. 7083-14-GEN3]